MAGHAMRTGTRQEWETTRESGRYGGVGRETGMARSCIMGGA